MFSAYFGPIGDPYCGCWVWLLDGISALQYKEINLFFFLTENRLAVDQPFAKAAEEVNIYVRSSSMTDVLVSADVYCYHLSHSRRNYGVYHGLWLLKRAWRPRAPWGRAN